MIRKIYLFLVAFIALGSFAVAQNNQGSIKVLLQDKKNKEAIPFANVVVYNGKVQVAVGTTDIDGYAFIKQLPAGKYNVKVLAQIIVDNPICSNSCQWFPEHLYDCSPIFFSEVPDFSSKS